MKLNREQQFELLLMSTMCDLDVDIYQTLKERDIEWPLMFKTTPLFYTEKPKLYAVSNPELDRKFSNEINSSFNQEKVSKFKSKILVPSIIKKLVGIDKSKTKDIVDFFSNTKKTGDKFSFEATFNDFANKVLYNLKDTKKLSIMRTFVANCDFMTREMGILDKSLFNTSLKKLDSVCQIDNPNAIPFH